MFLFLCFASVEDQFPKMIEQDGFCIVFTGCGNGTPITCDPIRIRDVY